MSSFSTPSFLAVSIERIAALSHTSLVTGSGSSCNQPLLANRPSSMVLSTRNWISISLGAVEASGLIASTSSAPRRVGLMRSNAVSATTPSCSDLRQKCSKNSTWLVGIPGATASGAAGTSGGSAVAPAAGAAGAATAATTGATAAAALASLPFFPAGAGGGTTSTGGGGGGGAGIFATATPRHVSRTSS